MHTQQLCWASLLATPICHTHSPVPSNSTMTMSESFALLHLPFCLPVWGGLLGLSIFAILLLWTLLHWFINGDTILISYTLRHIFQIALMASKQIISYNKVLIITTNYTYALTPSPFCTFISAPCCNRMFKASGDELLAARWRRVVSSSPIGWFTKCGDSLSTFDNNLI